MNEPSLMPVPVMRSKMFNGIRLNAIDMWTTATSCTLVRVVSLRMIQQNGNFPVHSPRFCSGRFFTFDRKNGRLDLDMRVSK